MFVRFVLCYYWCHTKLPQQSHSVISKDVKQPGSKAWDLAKAKITLAMADFSREAQVQTLRALPRKPAQDDSDDSDDYDDSDDDRQRPPLTIEMENKQRRSGQETPAWCHTCGKRNVLRAALKLITESPN